MWAAAEGHAEVVKLLLARGADPALSSTASTKPERRPPGGMTALLFAARQGKLDAARALLDGGADINQAGADTTSPLLDRRRQRPLRRCVDADRARREPERRRRERPHAAVCGRRPAQRAVVASAGARAAAGDASRDDHAAARCRRRSVAQDRGQGRPPRLVRHALVRSQRRHGVLARGLERRHRGHAPAARARRRPEGRDGEGRDGVAAARRRRLAARARATSARRKRSRRRSICSSRSSAWTSTPRRRKASRP